MSCGPDPERRVPADLRLLEPSRSCPVRATSSCPAGPPARRPHGALIGRTEEPSSHSGIGAEGTRHRSPRYRLVDARRLTVIGICGRADMATAEGAPGSTFAVSPYPPAGVMATLDLSMRQPWYPHFFSARTQPASRAMTLPAARRRWRDPGPSRLATGSGPYRRRAATTPRSTRTARRDGNRTGMPFDWAGSDDGPGARTGTAPRRESLVHPLSGRRRTTGGPLGQPLRASRASAARAR